MPEADLTRLIQTSMNDASSAPVALQGGVIGVSKTLLFSRRGGSGLEGLLGDFIRDGYYTSGNPTVLKWIGAVGGTILKIEDSFRQRIRGVVFDGGGKAAACVKLTKGVASGSNYQVFEDCAFKNAAAGIQCGEVIGDPNNADVIYERCIFYQLGDGLLTKNDQSVNHHFRSPTFLRCVNGINVERGGNLLISGGSAGQCDQLLRIRGGGPNASRFQLDSVRCEASGYKNRWMRLVDAVPSQGECHVLLQSCQEGGANQAGAVDNSSQARFLAGAGAIVELRNHKHAFDGGQRPYAEVNGGQFLDYRGTHTLDPTDRALWVFNAGVIWCHEPKAANGTDKQGYALGASWS